MSSNGRRSFLKFLGAGAAGTAIVKAEPKPEAKSLLDHEKQHALIRNNADLEAENARLRAQLESPWQYGAVTSTCSAFILPPHVILNGRYRQ